MTLSTTVLASDPLHCQQIIHSSGSKVGHLYSKMVADDLLFCEEVTLSSTGK